MLVVEQRLNNVVQLGISDHPLHGTPDGHVQLLLEEMLPVVSTEGDDTFQAPHVSRGGDVGIKVSNLDVNS